MRGYHYRKHHLEKRIKRRLSLNHKLYWVLDVNKNIYVRSYRYYRYYSENPKRVNLISSTLYFESKSYSTDAYDTRNKNKYNNRGKRWDDGPYKSKKYDLKLFKNEIRRYFTEE